MDQNIKNRLVGASVLLVLAVIVLPLLLDGANEEALLADLRLPARPEAPDPAALLDNGRPSLDAAREEIAREHAQVEPEPEPVPPVALAPAPAADAASAPAVREALSPAPASESPAGDRLARLGEAWDVQLAAVTQPAGAERLRDTLVAAGYKARVRRDGDRYKVVVGPVIRQEDARALLATLAADARVGKPRGMLVRYVP